MSYNQLNKDVQNYRGLTLQLVLRDDYVSKRAKEYYIVNAHGFLTDLKIWIPNSYLSTNGTIDTNADFMFIFADDKKEEIIKRAGFRYTYK